MAKTGPKKRWRWTEKRINSLVKNIRAYCREAESRTLEVIPGDEGKFKLLPPNLPTLSECIKKSGFNSNYIYELAKDYPRLSDALKKVKDISERMLVNLTLQGAYNSTFAIFAAKNMFKWRDERAIEHSGEVKGQETKIVLINNPQQEADGDRLKTLPEKIFV